MARPRRSTGLVVNPYTGTPKAPGPWVNESTCVVCGASYAAHRAFPGFGEGARRLRQAAKADGDEGGGFRSRRSVLWQMRVAKLEDWYMNHHHCGAGWDFPNRRPFPLGDRKMEQERLPHVIELIEDGMPDRVYVKGHHYEGTDSGERALQAAALYLEELFDVDEEGLDRDGEDWNAPKLRIGRQLYARWGFPTAGSDYFREFRAQATPRRGDFLVTEIVNVDAEERRRERRLADEREVAALVAFVQAWHPEATDVHGRPGARGHRFVAWKLPGLLGEVHWSEAAPASVYVQPRDLEAWSSRYGDRRRPSLDLLEPDAPKGIDTADTLHPEFS